MTREDQIQRILRYLTFADEWVSEDVPEDVPEDQLRYTVLPLNYFNGAFLDPNFEFLPGKSYQTLILNPLHEDNRELLTLNIGDWQHVLLNLGSPECPQHKGATCVYHLARFRKLPLKEVRGRLKFHTGDFVEWSHGWVYNNGEFETTRAIWERRGSDKWVAAGQPYALAETPALEEESNAIMFAKSAAFSYWYEWRVELGFDMPGRTMLPTVAIPTDPVSARTAYRLRDLPPGKSRREALKHWVTTYMRRKSPASDPDEQIRIWAHLRGAEEFTHNGLKCRIVPSQYDLMKAAEYQRLSQEEKRSAWRRVS